MIKGQTARLVSGTAAALLVLAVAPFSANAAPASKAKVTIGPILQSGDVVTGVRGDTNGNVILTGGVNPPNVGLDPQVPFLFQGRLDNSSVGAAVATFVPPFEGYTAGVFYGPDTHRFNPSTIPSGQVRAVGSYETTSKSVINNGMVYLGSLSGNPSSWRSIDVPSNGAGVIGHARACRPGTNCYVMDTIPHSTMGDLVVGDYDLDIGGTHRPVSANAFIYHLRSHRWTLLKINHSMNSKTTLYGVWQNGGERSHNYTLAGGTGFPQRGFLVNYNDQTGKFWGQKEFRFQNKRNLITHFEGITPAPGGFNVVAQTASMIGLGFIPKTRTGFGSARWVPVNVAGSSLCAGECTFTSGNTVFRNHQMGVYVPKSTNTPSTYLATIEPAASSFTGRTSEIGQGSLSWPAGNSLLRGY